MFGTQISLKEGFPLREKHQDYVKKESFPQISVSVLHLNLTGMSTEWV